MLSCNFNENVKDFITSYQAFFFTNSIKGIPAYWKNLSIFFMTLSSADLKWNELVFIINKLHKLNLSAKDIENLSYCDRCHLLNSNPVLIARRFQYRVEFFLKNCC